MGLPMPYNWSTAFGYPAGPSVPLKAGGCKRFEDVVRRERY
jgi:hypothetical protein